MYCICICICAFEQNVNTVATGEVDQVGGRKAVEGVRYVLLRWVVELVLSGAAETLLDAGVGPQAHHGGEQLGRVRLRVLHAADHVTDHLRVGLQKTHKEGGETHGSVLLVMSSVSATCKIEEDSSCTQSENSSWKEGWKWFWGKKKKLLPITKCTVVWGGTWLGCAVNSGKFIQSPLLLLYFPAWKEGGSRLTASRAPPLPLLFPLCSFWFIFQSLTSYMTIAGHSNNLPLACALISSCVADDSCRGTSLELVFKCFISKRRWLTDWSERARERTYCSYSPRWLDIQ